MSKIKSLRQFILAGVVCFLAMPAYSIDSNTWYKLTTSWQGTGKALDVINDGKNNKIHLANSGNYSGQFWKFTPTKNGYYRLTTQWQGANKSLDVINDGKNNRLHLAKTADYSGQHWKVKSLGNGYYRLTTLWQGDGKSLDIINDGVNNKLQLANTGNFSGQLWKLTPVNAVKPKNNVNKAIEAGPIWNQADANKKCPQIAKTNNGVWTGQWWTTVQGKMSVCQVRPANKRAVNAGPIWNQADANVKCPKIAKQQKAEWTGQWWTTVQGKMSVCQVQ